MLLIEQVCTTCLVMSESGVKIIMEKMKNLILFIANLNLELITGPFGEEVG